MHNFFTALYSFLNGRKLFSFLLFFSILGCLSFFALKLQFSEDITRLIPTNDKTNITTKVLSQLNFADKITVKISLKNNGSPEDAAEADTLFLNDLNYSINEYEKF